MQLSHCICCICYIICHWHAAFCCGLGESACSLCRYLAEKPQYYQQQLLCGSQERAAYCSIAAHATMLASSCSCPMTKKVVTQSILHHAFDTFTRRTEQSTRQTRASSVCHAHVFPAERDEPLGKVASVQTYTLSIRTARCPPGDRSPFVP